VLGWVAANRGDYATARPLYEESLETYRALGDELGIASLLDSLGVIARLERRYTEARALFGESLAVCGRAGDQRDRAQTLYNLGLTEILTGDLETACQCLEEALAIFRILEDRPGIAVALDNLGVVALRRREHDLARSHCEESLVIARDLGDRYRASFVLETIAGLAAAQGQPERALRMVGAVAALRESIGLVVTPAWRDRVEADLAPARRALDATAAATAVEQGRAMSLDQAISYALTTEPNSSHAIASGPTGGDGIWPLSSRQADVARLIARGLTNRQIAAALVVTEGTAANYVQRILARLGFTSRAQIAAWAVERGLGPSPHRS
jgi:DNA-binding CsgD family transcriptional regulator/Tfp pilus assembly protein PilF